jgi:hypothetical protein
MNKLTEDLNVIQNLPDQPTLSAQELKAKFDEAVGIIKEYLNSVVEPTITNIEGDYTTSEEFTNYKQEIKDITDAFQESIEGLGETIQNAVGTATNYGDFRVTSHQISFSLNGLEEKNQTSNLLQTKYYPLGVVGESLSNPWCKITKKYLSNLTSEKATFNFGIYNEDEGNTRSGTYNYYVLWVKIK